MTKIMGVINANQDSFFKDSRFSSLNVEIEINKMINDGANIIDIGGVSSRPGSKKISNEEEFSRVKDIISIISKNKLYEKIDFSLDSYSPLCLKYALDAGFSIINDITGLENSEVCELAKEYNSTVVIMHMQNNPDNMQNNPEYKDVIQEVNDFFIKRIKKAKNYNIKNIILDVGIGFGKTLNHNLSLINNINTFKNLEKNILIAASRKSMINEIIPCEVKDRLAGTLVLHLVAIRNGANFVRCHDVKEHFQAIKVQEALLNH